MHSFAAYMVEAQKYSLEARQVEEILGLGHLREAKFWSMVAHEGVSPRTLPLIQDVSFSMRIMPKFLGLLERGYETASAPEDGESLSPKLLSVILVEGELEHSRATRLIKALESIVSLYEVCARVEGLQGDDLVVVACDSGSDKAFDFLGAAKIVSCLKELILALWDRVVFFRESKVESKLKLIISSLPILTRLKEMEKSGTLSPEESELLRRQVVDGATGFLITGSTIPEIEGRTSFNPRLLLAPSPKQLTGGVFVDEQEATVSEVDSPLSAKERRTLANLQRRAERD